MNLLSYIAHSNTLFLVIGLKNEMIKKQVSYSVADTCLWKYILPAFRGIEKLNSSQVMLN